MILQTNSARKWIGEAAHTLELTRGLAERGWPVKLLVRKGSPLAARARDTGVDMLELNFTSRFNPHLDLLDARLIARLAGTHPGGAVIHCHRGKDHWCAQAARSILGLSAPLIRSRHVVLPVGGGPVNRWLFRRVTKVICVSEATRAGYLASGKLPATGLEVIHSGSGDLATFTPPSPQERAAARAELGLTPNDRVAVLVGRLQRVKGHRVFLEAGAQVAKEVGNAFYLIVGGGKNQAEYETLLGEHGLAERARLLGRRDDVPRILAACDLGVVASLDSEGFSRAALEYMGSGLPVVATRVGALPEIVVEGETGLIVDPGDPAALAEAMKKVLADASTARAMGAAGRKRAEQVFSRDAWLAAHEAAYHNCPVESARRN